MNAVTSDYSRIEQNGNAEFSYGKLQSGYRLLQATIVRHHGDP